MAGTKAARVKAAAIETPQTRDECDTWIGALGRAQRERVRIAAAMNDELAEVKARHEADAAPYTDEISRLTAGIQAFAEAHRDTLCKRGSKTVRLGLGTISWRTRPPKVSLRKVEVVIESIKSLGLTQFLRVKEEVNKDAMLADPERAKAIVGVSITSGEDFVVQPHETELEEVV